MDEARIARRASSPRLWLAGGWLLLALLAAIFAPLIAPQDPLAQDLMLERLPPFWLDGAEPGYWLGTDSLGRDLLSRLIFGGRIAFIVAFAAATSACLIGSALGLIAGYFGGWADRIISRVVDVWMAFPPVLFAILLVAVLGTGLSSVILAIAIIDWTRFCRVIRAEAMSQARMDYVESARIAGYGRIGIMLREVLPNVLPSVVALLSLEMGIAVIVEAILSFVNLSISTDDPTWGSIIAEGRLSIHQAWWVLVFPLITLILTVLSFSQFGEALKARFDPVLR
ncbi:ABC transporter permease [Mesorhizobium sp. LCM 4577]|jgi:peptide/nickel transport system permease protein|uniref:Dipeptide transporter membrane component of ABC superfamily n=1 Tax=Mesorhizobium plurifarium TaxID=69974 RepID=A0A090DRQ6_MESPL|nr:MULTISPECIES: ABC transporter permease [unclassified Mesorhizobium]OHV58163.1 ABC transporter permease [Mesorhizobium sp. LCM 4576]OHV71342.1 ABC transporter permease [Mesorhizobium sp. LCM 4577]CDX16772.1 dipeptide transporter; membrane component of ABC superfamily [Mesorhizobium plurifarium]CDX50660.1 dipeptide transporter; membrane component of ABC superfamily [Mesorhizobium plurifarium]